MSRQIIYIPANSPDDWKAFLAKPDVHWKTGYSARTLAYAWHGGTGFPDEIDHLLKQSNFEPFRDVTPLLVLPEYKVPLKGHGPDSQNDLFVLAKAGDQQLVSMTIEGKVEEPFNNKLKVWKQSDKGFTIDKQTRLAYLQEQLGLEEIPDSIYYQLLHRSTSAIIEARRFNAAYAVMLVHSFSQKDSWFDEYAQFAALYGHTAEKDRLIHLASLSDVEFYSGWVSGNPKYLSL